MTDPELIQLFSSNGTVDLTQFPLEDLRRVLWLAASAQVYLPQAIGNDIDAEIKDRPIREQAARYAFLGSDECML